jgi:TPR repeat protein
VGWCSTAHQKAHWKAGHKAACRPAETKLVPYMSWEQRIMAEAEAAAPASLAAWAKLAPIPHWDGLLDGAPPTVILKAWRKAAEGGHAGAQTDLGFCYEIGKGVALDHRLAAEWYAKAAVQGHAIAQSNFGVCYELGKGVAQDYKLAVEWYAKAAVQGYAIAQSNLGVCYEGGKGVAQDYKLAVEWYAKAAAQGYAAGQHNLGRCYQHGQVVAQDFKLAASFYGKAAEQGFAGAAASRDACLAQLASAGSSARRA